MTNIMNCICFVIESIVVRDKSQFTKILLVFCLTTLILLIQPDGEC